MLPTMTLDVTAGVLCPRTPFLANDRYFFGYRVHQELNSCFVFKQ